MIEIKLQKDVILFQRGGDSIIVPFTAPPEVHAASYKVALTLSDDAWYDLLVAALAVEQVTVTSVGKGQV